MGSFILSLFFFFFFFSLTRTSFDQEVDFEERHIIVIPKEEFEDLDFCTHVNYSVAFQVVLKEDSHNISKAYIKYPDGKNISLEVNLTSLHDLEKFLEFVTVKEDFSIGRNTHNTFNGTYDHSIVNITEIEDHVKEIYHNFNSTINRMDCEEFYPYEECDTCRHTYKNFLCSTYFAKWEDWTEEEIFKIAKIIKTSSEKDNATAALKSSPRMMCADICYEVVRKCPPALKFYCPLPDDGFSLGLFFSTSYSCNSYNTSLTSYSN